MSAGQQLDLTIR